MSGLGSGSGVRRAYPPRWVSRVKVVAQADEEAHMAQLRAQGNHGMLDKSLSRATIEKGDQQYLPKDGGN